VAMPPLYVQVRDDLAGIMFDVFGTQRSKQLLQRHRGRLGSLVEVVYVHCGPRNVRLLDYSAKRLGDDSRPISASNFPARSGTNITGHLVIHPIQQWLAQLPSILFALMALEGAIARADENYKFHGLHAERFEGYAKSNCHC
jgi:hypothetical protein